MTKEEMYYQCVFQRGTERTIGFVPERAARKGALVELTNIDDGPAWECLSVGHRMTKSSLMRKQNADRNQRKASDI